MIQSPCDHGVSRTEKVPEIPFSSRRERKLKSLFSKNSVLTLFLAPTSRFSVWKCSNHVYSHLDKDKLQNQDMEEAEYIFEESLILVYGFHVDRLALILVYKGGENE